MSANVDWVEAAAQLDHFERDLKDGWDGYGGRPLTAECLATARLLADRACIVPLSSGGVCFSFGPDENVLFTVGNDGLITEFNFEQVPGPRWNRREP